MATTISDVAQRAGVGVGTVSRVLNDSPQVRAPTRERVLAAIHELNFRPSSMARRLAQGRTLTIGVIAPFFTRPAFVERLRGVEAALAQSAYDLIVYNVETTEKRDACFRDIAASHRVDGLIVVSLPPNDADVQRWQNVGVPTVLVDAAHPQLSRVVVNNVAGGRIATEHLITLGHRRIAYISDPLTSSFGFTSSRDRFRGYRNALTKHRIRFRPEYHQQAEHGRSQAKAMTERLLALHEPPTAIFAASDTQAWGALEALRQHGRKTPGDVAVIGYDDIEIAEYLNLSTIHQPMYESGLKGVELLLKQIEQPEQKIVRLTLPQTLMARQTTAGRKGGDDLP